MDALARQWHYKGKAVEGEIQKVEDRVVMIKKQSGGVLIANLHDLSTEDQRYVREYLKNPRPATATSSSRPRSEPRPAEPTPAEPAPAAPAGESAWSTAPVAPVSPASPWETVTPSGQATPGEVPSNLADIQPGVAPPAEPAVREAPAPAPTSERRVPLWRKIQDKGTGMMMMAIVIGVVLAVLFFLFAAILLRWSCNICGEKPALARCAGAVLLTQILSGVVKGVLGAAISAPFLRDLLGVGAAVIVAVGVFSSMLDVSAGKAICIFVVFAVLTGLVVGAIVGGGALVMGGL